MAHRQRNENSAGVAPHSRIPHEVTDGPAWRVLNYSAKALFIDLRAKLRSTNNGNINATLSELKHRGWTHPGTLSNALRQLEHMGFIAKTRQGGVASLSKLCSLFRFTDLQVHEHPKQGIAAIKATHDYRRFESVGEAKAAISELNGKKSKLRKSKLEATKIVAVEPIIATEIVAETPAKLRKVNKTKRTQTSASAGNSGK